MRERERGGGEGEEEEEEEEQKRLKVIAGFGKDRCVLESETTCKDSQFSRNQKMNTYSSSVCGIINNN